jgi:hypothetical protein
MKISQKFRISVFIGMFFVSGVLIGYGLWIGSKQVFATPQNHTPSFHVNIFHDAPGWEPRSSTRNLNDLIPHAWFYRASSDKPTTIIDMNGDGLQDMVVHYIYGGAKWGFAIFINKGNVGYQYAYKCFVQHTSPGDPNTIEWRGDCAQQ